MKPHHYQKVLYITVIYSDELHPKGKDTRWLVQIEHDFPEAAKSVLGIQRIEVRKKRVYDHERARDTPRQPA